MRPRNAFKNRVFEASEVVPTKTLLLKHYYRRQGVIVWISSKSPQKRLFSSQGRKNSININFLVRISRGYSRPLRPNALGSKSFSPPPGPRENALFGADVHDFRRGRPRPEGLSKNFVQKKFALIFWRGWLA